MTARRRPPVRSRLAAIAFAAALVTAPALLLTGAATAEDDPWAGSGFDQSFNLTESSTLNEITGGFHREGWTITGDSPSAAGDDDRFITGDKLGTPGCGEIEARGVWTGTSNRKRSFVIERQSGLGWERSFEFPCNGTYRVAVSTFARSCTPSSLNPNRCAGSTAPVDRDHHTISSKITVAVPPVAARGVAASVLAESDSPSSTSEPEESIQDVLLGGDDAGASTASAAPAAPTGSVQVTWRFPSQPEPDATYVVQRAGPNSGSFKPVSDVLDADDDTTITDTVSFSGTYKYRVLAVRPGATDDQAVSKPSNVASVEVTGLPDPPGSNDDGDDDGDDDGQGDDGDDGGLGLGPANPGSLPHLDGSGRGGSSSGGVSLPTRPTVTTLDTGYDETLDYGDLAEPGELAAEGQSIIRTPDFDGPAILPALAGGLVLLGWAGHAFYLSRLARQF